MKILVTGATGNVGKYVCDFLLSMGEEVVAGVNNVERGKKILNPKCEIVNFDFTDSTTFSMALDKVDRVFLMRPPKLGNPKDLLPFIDEMKVKNIKLVTFLSLMGVENNPVPPHHKIEKFIEGASLPYCHIRPGFFMQNLSGVHLKEIKDNNEIFIPAGRSRCSFIDAMDIGEAIATILYNSENYKNTTHTITGMERLDYYEIADILSYELNRNITYTKPNSLKFRNYMIKTRKLDKEYVNVMVMLYFMTKMKAGEKITTEFEEIVGRKPTTFRTFVKNNIHLF